MEEPEGDDSGEGPQVTRRGALKGMAGIGGILGLTAARRHPYAADMVPYLSGRIMTECDMLSDWESSTSGADSDPWSIAVLPDTQYYAEDPALIQYAEAQARWIVENRDEENIVFATYVGDLVQDGSDPAQWDRIEDVIDILDGVIPYGTVPGNHDWELTADKSSSIEQYVDRFGADRYDDRDWYGGTGPDGLSHYQYVSGGDRELLHLGLEWEPRDKTLAWAQAVLDEHPEMPTAVTTHAYLTDTPGASGRIDQVTEESRTTSSMAGEDLYQELIRSNDQIFTVFCGHSWNGLLPWNEGEYRQTAKTISGNTVYELLSNYQGRDNGGNGWMRLYTVVPSGGSCDAAPDRIEARTYSPAHDTYQRHLPSEFTYELDLTAL